MCKKQHNIILHKCLHSHIFQWDWVVQIIHICYKQYYDIYKIRLFLFVVLLLNSHFHCWQNTPDQFNTFDSSESICSLVVYCTPKTSSVAEVAVFLGPASLTVVSCCGYGYFRASQWVLARAVSRERESLTAVIPHTTAPAIYLI